MSYIPFSIKCPDCGSEARASEIFNLDDGEDIDLDYLLTRKKFYCFSCEKSFYMSLIKDRYKSYKN